MAQENKAKKSIGIVGGGMMGLSLAYYLSKDGYEVTIIEKANKLGGLASSFNINGHGLELYYHHFFRGDVFIQDLVKELGLGSELDFLESKMGIYINNGLHDFSHALDILKFTPLNFFQRLRLGLVSLYLQRFARYEQFKDYTALEWCNKYFGKSITKIMWEPLLRSKFGENFYRDISMVWFFARIKDRSSSRDNPIKNEKLGYVKGGIGTIIKRLEEKLKEQHVEVLLEADIIDTDLVGKLKKITVRTQRGTIKKTFSHVVVTSGVPKILTALNLAPEILAKWNKVNYIGAICLVLELKKSLMPYYWLSINDPKEAFVAVVEHTNFVEQDLFKGSHILYLGKYLESSNPTFTASDLEIQAQAESLLKKINPEFKKDWIISKNLFRAGIAQHIVTKDYEIPPLNSGIPNVYIAHFNQIYPHDRGTNYAVEQAQDLYKLIKAK